MFANAGVSGNRPLYFSGLKTFCKIRSFNLKPTGDDVASAGQAVLRSRLQPGNVSTRSVFPANLHKVELFHLQWMK